MTVPKRDGSIKVCRDYKVTVNAILDVDKYPLPQPEDIFATLTGGKKFTTLDLSHAYNQLILDEESRKYIVVNTYHGLYHSTGLTFGIATAFALFQCVMDQILQGMDKITCYLDDILITGKSDEEHLISLSEVLQRLQNHKVRLKKSAALWRTVLSIWVTKWIPKNFIQQIASSKLLLMNLHLRMYRNFECF